MGEVIRTINLDKSFRLGKVELKVLKDVNITIKEGEFVSIMGPSGSGKSTLLYLLGGLDRPSSGIIEIMGKQISKMKDREQSIMRRKELGFVFQFYNLIPNLNVEENIMLPVLLDKKPLKDYKKKLKDILEITQIYERRKHTPAELSGGQQQRVAIARALINEPNIILADEPIGNLDSKSGTAIMELLKEVNEKKGKTIVQVTHSRNAASYGKRIINVKDGMVEEE